MIMCAKQNNEHITRAKEVFDMESDAILGLKSQINEDFSKAVELIYNTKGRLIITGIGKAGIIGQKISATLASTGTPSVWVHSAEALHGDLGRITKKDTVMMLSNSGESEEVIKLIPVLKKIGTPIIAITGNESSTLARYSDLLLLIKVNREACPLNLAPTTSTTAMLAMGDALAVCLIEKRNFRKDDFALFHPGGLLGKRLLLKVKDIMRTGKACPQASPNEKVRDVLLKITQARAGAAIITDKNNKLIGIFTDGDLRRHLEEAPDIVSKQVKDVMTSCPLSINEEDMAQDAFNVLQSKKIDELPVVNNAGKVVGMLDVQDLLKAGL